ncbi:unnamed protein product [Hymenolepis diminuta]|uniref:Uncharacterized protein n=1 Tax=Hymenolepis diminuta TaxID=6216 RepID=A0A0R3SIB2_HYMDI|nr:unnamed protein product [Hymenolepis diminuta]
MVRSEGIDISMWRLSVRYVLRMADNTVEPILPNMEVDNGLYSIKSQSIFRKVKFSFKEIIPDPREMMSKATRVDEMKRHPFAKCFD